MSITRDRLDAAESVFFQRELEAIDARSYDIRYASHRAREFVPSQPGIPEWARVYTWRENDQVGDARIMATDADDLPAVNAFSTEHSKIIKLIGASYCYGVMEIKAAAAMGRPLDDSLARSARRAISKTIDNILALGSAKHGLEGLLTLADAKTFTPVTKAAGGLIWGTTAVPNATAEEMVDDLSGIANERNEATSGEFDDFAILLPLAQYNLATRTRMGIEANNQSVLDYVLNTNPYISSIDPWYKCDDVGGTTRMACYPRDVEVVAGIVPQEFTPMAPQLTDLTWKVPVVASCGGVVARYPVAIAYGDGI